MPIGDLIFVDDTGLHTPDFATILSRFQQDYFLIYGADSVLDPSSQDGQWISIQARAAYDTVQLLTAVYNSFSPATAQSDALSRDVKINGLQRKTPTFSQVDLTLTGQTGTQITSGQAGDNLGQTWNLPAVVVLPLSGSITVTAFAAQEGAIPAQAGSITRILTPTNGWQTVTNLLPAVEGQPVEVDAQLRRRQSQSTMLPSLSVFDGIWGALEGLTGVFEVKGYENPTASTTLEGIPPYSMAFVLIGGIDQEIGDTIRLKKTAGTPTFGTQSVISIDTHGQTTQIFFSKAVTNTIGVNIALTALAGYVSTTGEAIKLAVSQYIDSLSIGSTIYVSKLCPPAELYNAPESNTYRITSITANKNAGPFVSTQITQAFNESAQCLPANVAITVS